MPVRTAACRLATALISAGFVIGIGLFPINAHADAGFQNWVRGFRATATSHGVSGAIYDRAFRGVTEIDPEVLEKARYQPEFTAPVWDYFDNRVQEDSIATGRQMTSYHSIRTDVKNAGATWVDEEVVVDDGIVTSRSPDDLPAFVAKVIEEISEGSHPRT